MAQALPLSPQSEQRKKQEISGYKHIEDRQTPELIFAFVEPIGGGADDAIRILEGLIKKAKFDYKVNSISVSSIIERESDVQGLTTTSVNRRLKIVKNLSSAAKRIDKLQQLGNKLREKNANDFLAKKIIQEISDYRVKNGGLVAVDENTQRAEPLRVAHIVKSLKNKKELDLLRAVYGNMLILIAVSGSFSQHLKNYTSSSTTTSNARDAEKELAILADIDQDEGVGHGQQVREIFYKADLFLDNNGDRIKNDLSRFLALLFGQTISSPTLNEKMMFEAFASSLRSCCLSRQVGAAIASNNGELISTGWNDVPAYGGGLATEENEIAKKTLCKEIEGGGCHSNESINKLLKKIIEGLQDEDVIGEVPPKVFEKKAPSLIKKTGLSGLIEFSRAIHAEMEAILSAARTGKYGLTGGILFVTTYPCENCVKHILAAGIHKVVYIEPYPKSRAKDFFPDSIVDANSSVSKENKLIFSQFTGISPQSYMKLFRQSFERKNKDTGKYSPQGDGALPLTDVFLDGFTIYESRILQQMKSDKENSHAK